MTDEDKPLRIVPLEGHIRINTGASAGQTQPRPGIINRIMRWLKW